VSRVPVIVGGALLGGLLLISQFEPAAMTPPPIRPQPVVESGGGRRLLIRGDAEGSCYVSARANGAVFDRLLLDTGASGYLTFGRNHAARLGYNAASLPYVNQYGSANGVGYEAFVRLREFRLGSFVMRDVIAAITETPQDAPLVGIEILRRLNLRLGGGNCELLLR
jgi:clan AA aspartic protease (TIGR02281 family)